MQPLKRDLGGKARWTGAAVAVVAVLAFATPAAAADKDFKGWFFALDLALTQPAGLEHHFADNIDSFSDPANTTRTRLLLDNDSDGTFRGTVGYGFGLGFGSLQASYWSFDNDDSESRSVIGILSPAIFGYGYNGVMYVYNPTYTASSKVKAQAIDLDYLRPMDAGEQFTVTWLAGLRAATYEEDQDFRAVEGTGLYTYIQHKHFESDALGLKLGASANFDFTPRFGLQGDLAFSLLYGSNEGQSFQTSDSSIFCVASAPPCFDRNFGEDDSVRGSIRDLDLKAVWTVGDLDYYVGLSMSSWDGLVGDPVPATSTPFGAPGVVGPSRDEISFNSVHAGLLWRIGGRRLSGP